MSRIIKSFLDKFGAIILSMVIIVPVTIRSQEWQFDPDSLNDNGLQIPLLIGPFIEGVIPEGNFGDNEFETGKEYNGFQVQVLETNSASDAQYLRMELITRINHTVTIVFEAPNYKVRVGAFTNRRDAEQLQRQLIGLNYNRAWIVRARLIR